MAISSLRLIPGERRSLGRPHQADKLRTQLFINSQFIGDCEMLGGLPGTIALQLENGTTIPEILLKSNTSLEAIRNDKPLVDGVWQLLDRRADGSKVTLVFSVPGAEELGDIPTYVPAEAFHRTTSHRSLNAENDTDELSQHFTEIRDFPLPVKCRIRNGVTTQECVFDFSSGSKALDCIDLKFDGVLSTDIKAGKKVVIDYSFLGGRYLWSATCQEVDGDFGLASVLAPSRLYAFTLRNCGRTQCDAPLLVKTIGSEVWYEAKLENISSVGGEISLKNDCKVDLGTSFFLKSVSSTEITALSVSKRAGRIGFRFSDLNADARNGVMKFVAESLQEPLTTRKPENYSEFLELYASVGYAPKDTGDMTPWDAQSRKVWSLVDEHIPGNCTGGYFNGKLVSAYGTLPLSSTVTYGHSLCLEKTAASAGLMLDQLVLQLGWANILDGITHYAGSFAKHSKFTSRLFQTFACSTSPKTMKLVHTDRIFFDPMKHEIPEPDGYFTFNRIERLDLGRVPEGLCSILKLLSSHHPALEGLHEHSFYEVTNTSTGETVAVAVNNHSEKNITAANVFEYCWIFAFTPEITLDGLANCARNVPELNSTTLQLIIAEGACVPQARYTHGQHVPAFWTFVPHEDLGPLIASVYKSVYAVLRKYGPEAMCELVRCI